MTKYVSITLLLGTVLLSACSAPRLSERISHDHQTAEAGTSAIAAGPSIASLDGAMVAGGSADADRRAREQLSRVVLRRADRPFIASVSIPMGSSDKLPAVFREPVRLNFVDTSSGGKVGLRTVADRLTQVTGVPVRVKSDVYQEFQAPVSRAMPASAGMGAGSVAPGPGLPPGASAASPVSPRALSVSREPGMQAVSMRWNGSLEGFLNHVTDLTNLSWEYREGVIVIERFRTEFFELATLDGETQYSMGLNSSEQGNTGGSGVGSGGGLGSNSANADVTEKGRAAASATLIASINQMIAGTPGASVIRSEGSGRIAVTAPKDTMSKVRTFIRAENESMLRQAQIQFDIYSVRRDLRDERGVNWQLVVESVSRALKMNVASPAMLTSAEAGSVNFTVLRGDPPVNTLSRVAADSAAVLRSLNRHGNFTQHRPVSLLTLNRQWARKASLGSKAYVSETVPGTASTYGAGAPGLKTATVTTGDRYLAQPFIMDNNTVVLKFGIGLSSLGQMAEFTSGAGVNEQRVQIPEISNLIDQSTVALKAGQVLVITGLSRVVSSDAAQTLGEDVPWVAGGSKNLVREREDFVIFVRPTIL